MTSLLLIERTHVDPTDLRGDLFPRRWTGIGTFVHTPPDVEPAVDESWNQTFPVSERREDAWLR